MNPKTALKIIIILSLAGMAVDSLLTYNKISYSRIGCPVGGGCDIVTGSIYSEFFAIPVSLFGLGAFMFFIAASLLALNGKFSEKNAFQLIIAVSAIGLVIAVWFVYVMVYLLNAICPWCVLSHTILLGIFAVSVYAFLKMQKG
jgi:uncharacterized membrane protein